MIVLPPADAPTRDREIVHVLVGGMGATLPAHPRPDPSDPRLARFRRVVAADELGDGDLESSPLFGDLLARAADPAPFAQRAAMADAWGILQLAAERTEEAAKSFTTAARHYRRADDPHGQARALMNLGRAFLDAGYHEGAVESFRVAGATSNAFGDRKGFARAAAGLGLTHLLSDYLEQAASHAEFALQLDREEDESDVSIDALDVLCRVHARRDEPELTRRCAEQRDAVERRLRAAP